MTAAVYDRWSSAGDAAVALCCDAVLSAVQRCDEARRSVQPGHSAQLCLVPERALRERRLFGVVIRSRSARRVDQAP